MENHPIDEASPLLSDSQKKKIKTAATPLPKSQIFILLILQLCEPIACYSIYPYINRLVSELDITGGDPRKVGYYAGLIESLYYATEAMTILQWSRVSDHVGRKPILLFGLAGTALSMLCFGLSRTFWGLVISRCICGMLNGNIGVMKSALGELTDSSNRAEGFALIPMIWSIGSTAGPLMGGSLARPHERFPAVFSGDFWKEYPYFLPCAVSAGCVFVSFMIALLFFKETLPKRSRRRNSSDSIAPSQAGQPLPLCQLFVFPVVVSVSNYVSLAFLEIMLFSLVPLFMTMPPEIGGMGTSQVVIGYILGVQGAVNGVVQTAFFAKVVRRFGERRIFLLSMATFPCMFALFPIMSTISKNNGPTWIVWALLTIILLLMVVTVTGYGCVFIYVTASAPNRHSLGATHGLSQTTVSIFRAIGPALATSMFSFSVEKNLLGGNAVYIVLFVSSCLAMPLAMLLPEQVWEEKD
ncbi:hypothetical protein AMATHDRAFT_191973 [Amanita thiersii Skay4041]|uniref:Major facilitator superfamily (MFS) profile domain-containing protein n=1 Tax=Amanita thiersii Skay4041 TaxID=703135 RepID=A0A2A9NRY7_9AGAR|nr:hypothetical protein AMATHDRAFT_191973 [Amanita thiersii Skay4041]